MNRPRAIALALTAIIAAAIFVWLWFARVFISMAPPQWPPVKEAQVTVEENFFDVIEEPALPLPSADDPAQAINDLEANNLSTPAPASGSDLKDAGKAGEPSVPVTSPNPSPIKQKVEPAAPAGPSKEELEQDEARRKANAAVNSAFSHASGADNTLNQGTKEGNSGSPEGSSNGINGIGSGSVGGGWFIPNYSKVPSTVTGSIRVMVKIDSQGNVTSLTFIGGDAPAATNQAIRAAVEREIRSRRFTRGSSPAPSEATAYITYRFR